MRSLENAVVLPTSQRQWIFLEDILVGAAVNRNSKDAHESVKLHKTRRKSKNWYINQRT